MRRIVQGFPRRYRFIKRVPLSRSDNLMMNFSVCATIKWIWNSGDQQAGSSMIASK
jgi:hypothetical protein